MHTASFYSAFALLFAAFPAASAYYDDFDLMPREAYLAGYAEGRAAANREEPRINLAVRDLLDDYDEDYAFWTRGNSMSTQNAKKEKIKQLQDDLDYAKRMLADAQKDKMNQRIINDLKMKVMNAQGALAAAKGK